MEDSSLQHISTYRPLEQQYGIVLARGKLSGRSGTGNGNTKRTAYTPDAYQLLVLRIRPWRQAPNPAFDIPWLLGVMDSMYIRYAIRSVVYAGRLANMGLRELVWVPTA